MPCHHGFAVPRSPPTTTTCTSFCNIVSAAVLENQMLGLPKRFVRILGNDLPEFAVLKVPKGKAWSVELKKHEGGVYFCKGWRDFANHYSLCIGYFLVFIYDGNSQFDVVICDMTGCEIDYKHGRGISVPSIEENVSQSHDKTSTKGGTIKAAKALKLNNPSFTVIMRPSYLELVRYSYLPIPLGFTKQHFIEKVGSVKLQVSDGRTWDIGCYNNRGRYKLVGGWKAFLTEMNLKVGNVCVFELISEKKVELKVYILRGA